MIVRTSCKMQHHPKSCPREKDPAGLEMGWRVLGSWVPVLQKGYYSFQAIHHFPCEDSSLHGWEQPEQNTKVCSSEAQGQCKGSSSSCPGLRTVQLPHEGGSKVNLYDRHTGPTPVLFPGESHGQRRLAGYDPQGHKESDTTEPT